MLLTTASKIHRWADFRSIFGGFCCLVTVLALALEVRSQNAPAPGYRAHQVRHRAAEDLAPQLRNLLSGLAGESKVLVDQDLNRLIVQGPPQAHELTADLLKALDQPPARPRANIPTGVARGYRTPGQDPRDVATALQQRFPTAKIEADMRTGQVIVSAPTEMQREVAATLNGMNQDRNQRQPVEQAGNRHGYKLRHLSWRDFEQRLGQLWGTRLGISTSQNGESATVVIKTANGPQPVLRIDRRANVLHFEGTEPHARIWRRVVEMIDFPQGSNQQAALVSLRNAQPVTIQRAMAILKAVNSNENRGDVTAAVPLRRGNRARWGGDLVATMFQDGQADSNQPQQPAPPGQAPPPGGPPRGPAADEEEGTGLIGAVQIEFLGDVIIIRGNPRDVARVRQLIKEIEAQSVLSQPEVEVYPLQHVNSEAVVTLIEELYDETLAPIIGEVSIRALVEPNSILLIGSKERLDFVKGFIKKLDQPADAASRFEVFRLKYIAALDAETAVRNFFVNRPGFDTEVRGGIGARVQVAADYRTNTLIVQASPRDLAEVKRFIATIDIEEPESEAQVRVFKLKNALADELSQVLQAAISGQTQGGQQAQPQQPLQPGGAAAPSGSGTTQRLPSVALEFMLIDQDGGRLLRSGVLADVQVTADANTNSLIIRAPAKSMELIAALVDQLDALPEAEAQIKVFTILNGDATSLAAMLQQLFGQQVTIGQGTGGAFGAAFRTTQLPAATASGEGSLVPLNFAVDVRTNSILTSGSAGDLDVVEALLLRLDESDVNTNVLRVVRLKNTASDSVALAVQNYIQLQQQNLSFRVQQGLAITPFEQLEREIIVISEPQSNSVVVSSSPRYVDEIMTVIKDLDYRQPMVMVQVIIAEVRLDHLFQFGAEFGLQDSLLFDRSLGTVSSGLIDPIGGPAFNFNNAQGPTSSASNQGSPFLPNFANFARSTVGAQGLSNFALGRTTEAGYGGLVLSAASDSVAALLRALERDGSAQILSRPQIMALNNREAFVQVGQTVSRITDSTIGVNGQVTNSVSDVETGLILAVVPTINEDDVLHLFVLAERSFLGDDDDPGSAAVATDAQGNAIRSAPINRQQAQTTISCRSGQTVVFAGLITKDNEVETRRVPYLSNIPVVGNLFKFDQSTETRSELLIVMTPYIVKEDQDYDWIKIMETERMSWCLADVVEMHGDVGLSGGHGHFSSHETPLIMPSENPTGEVILPLTQPGLPQLESSRRLDDAPLLPVEYGARLPGPQTIAPASLQTDPALRSTGGRYGAAQ
jgi:type II secretory pathway component GspD/PulD (secretin)